MDPDPLSDFFPFFGPAGGRGPVADPKWREHAVSHFPRRNSTRGKLRRYLCVSPPENEAGQHENDIEVSMDRDRRTKRPMGDDFIDLIQPGLGDVIAICEFRRKCTSCKNWPTFQANGFMHSVVISFCLMGQKT